MTLSIVSLSVCVCVSPQCFCVNTYLALHKYRYLGVVSISLSMGFCIKPLSVSCNVHKTTMSVCPSIQLSFLGVLEPIPADVGKEAGNTLNWSPAKQGCQTRRGPHCSYCFSLVPIMTVNPHTVKQMYDRLILSRKHNKGIGH